MNEQFEAGNPPVAGTALAEGPVDVSVEWLAAQCGCRVENLTREEDFEVRTFAAHPAGAIGLDSERVVISRRYTVSRADEVAWTCGRRDAAEASSVVVPAQKVRETIGDRGAALPARATGHDQVNVLADAESFLVDPELGGDRQARLSEVRAQIARTGTYWHDFAELSYGARLAWRNHARCIGRAAWKSLIVIDRRSCNTPDKVFSALTEHLRAATNDGRIRPMISIFRPGWRVHNEQLVRYAGWRQPDGTILGDPRNAGLTETALRLGWPGPRTRGRFDVLPVIVSGPDHPPRWYELPSELVLEVPLTHPEYDWFADLGLRWHALPMISNMVMSVGGVGYTLAPFNGWYVSGEIGARNLSDAGRYAMLRPVAERLGLDTSSTATLWLDRAQLELVTAVQTSFAAAGVTIVDHHRVDGQFVRWSDREHAAGRPVPTDWAWMISPAGASTGMAFHRTFDNTDIRPNFYYQSDPAQTEPFRSPAA